MLSNHRAEAAREATSLSLHIASKRFLSARKNALRILSKSLYQDREWPPSSQTFIYSYCNEKKKVVKSSLRLGIYSEF